MKASAIVCAVLAGTFGLSSVAQAQSWRDHGHDRGQRGEHHQQRGDHRWEGRRDHDRRDGWNHQQPRHMVQQPRYVYQQPRYGYQQPHDGYRQRSHRFYRGGYLPHEYRNRGYYVSNWQSYPGLYAPAYGQQWVNVNGDFLLVALATGLIANALVH